MSVKGIAISTVCFFLTLFSSSVSAYQVHFVGSIVEETCGIANNQKKIISNCRGVVTEVNYDELLRNRNKPNTPLPDSIKSVALTKINEEADLFFLNVEYL